MSYPVQLSLGVTLKDDATFSNFFVEEGNNTQAIAALKMLAERGESSSVFIWGKHGSGLSHLLQAACHAHSESLHSRHNNSFAQYLPLDELICYPAEQVCEGLEGAEILCVDDIDLVVGKSDWEQGMFHLFNRLKDSGRSMLTSSHSSPSELGIGLADLKSRMLGSDIYHITELSDAAKGRALIMRARKRGLQMSHDVCAYIMRRSSRDAAALFQLLDLLDEQSLQKQRKLTIPFVKDVLLTRQLSMSERHS